MSLRIEQTGTLRRFRYMKRSRSRNVLSALMEDCLKASLHKEGKLDAKYYWPEWACVSFEKGQLAIISPHAFQLKFGTSGRSCKRYWEAIPDSTRVRIRADVTPYENLAGAYIRRLIKLEPVEDDDG